MKKHDNDALKLYIKEQSDKDRERNDTLYAIKLVERIVFALLGVITLAVLYALLKSLNL